MVECWGVEKVTCFDPGVPELSNLSSARFDIVVSTDVLEHCPEDGLPWIMDEMIGKAERFVFATVTLYPAQKSCPMVNMLTLRSNRRNGGARLSKM